MDFNALHGRLLDALRLRLSNGEISERHLARLVGISQPHMHNVLKGVRFFSPEVADRVIRTFGISLLALFPREEVRRSCWDECADLAAGQVAVLEGCLGPGLPLPTQVSPVERHPFERTYLRSLDRPALVRLAPDPFMSKILWENDLALLDHSEGKRLNPEPEGLYVINRRGEGLVRRLKWASPRLELCGSDPWGQPDPGEVILLERTHLLDVVRAKVVWLGRYLDAHR